MMGHIPIADSGNHGQIVMPGLFTPEVHQMHPRQNVFRLFLDLHHVLCSRQRVLSGNLADRRFSGATREERKWESADAGMQRVQGPLQKGGIWWNLLHRPMVAVSEHS